MVIQREVNPMVFETRCIGQSVTGQSGYHVSLSRADLLSVSVARPHWGTRWPGALKISPNVNASESNEI